MLVNRRFVRIIFQVNVGLRCPPGPDGFLLELQLSLTPLHDVKQTVGHKHYERIRQHFADWAVPFHLHNALQLLILEEIGVTRGDTARIAVADLSRAARVQGPRAVSGSRLLELV